jgi:hypothetical protein
MKPRPINDSIGFSRTVFPIRSTEARMKSKGTQG